MTNAPAPKRRWLRFSLRTLFVAMTILGGWLGYELNWIQQRHQAIGNCVVEPGLSLYAPPPPRLAIFGERGYDTLLYVPIWATDESFQAYKLMGTVPQRRLSEKEIEALPALFPESTIRSIFDSGIAGIGPAKSP